MIDGQQLSNPAAPELRFRGPQADRFAASTNALKNPAGPILFASDHTLQDSTIAPTWNTDFGHVIFTLMIGGPRFRHVGKRILIRDRPSLLDLRFFGDRARLRFARDEGIFDDAFRRRDENGIFRARDR